MNMRKGLALLLCATLLFSCLPAGLTDRAAAEVEVYSTFIGENGEEYIYISADGAYMLLSEWKEKQAEAEAAKKAAEEEAAREAAAKKAAEEAAAQEAAEAAAKAAAEAAEEEAKKVENTSANGEEQVSDLSITPSGDNVGDEHDASATPDGGDTGDAGEDDASATPDGDTGDEDDASATPDGDTEGDEEEKTTGEETPDAETAGEETSSTEGTSDPQQDDGKEEEKPQGDAPADGGAADTVPGVLITTVPQEDDAADTTPADDDAADDDAKGDDTAEHVHEWVKQDPVPEYSADDEKTHTVTITVMEKCACGAEQVAEQTTEQKAHLWEKTAEGHACALCGFTGEHQYNPMAECTVCGYSPELAQRKCEHEFETVPNVGTPDQKKEYIKDDDNGETHTVHVTDVIYNGKQVCTKCGYSEVKDIVTGERDEEVPHTFTSLDADSHRCGDCGYVGTHDWTEQTAEDGTTVTVCTLCGEEQKPVEEKNLFDTMIDVAKNLFGGSEETETETEDLNGTTVTIVDEDGVEHQYTLSDFVPGETTDGNAEAGIMVMDMVIDPSNGKGGKPDCTHTWKVTGKSFSGWGDPIKEPSDLAPTNAFHYKTRTVTASLLCTKCGATATGTGSDVMQEPHQLEGNVCKKCGKEVTSENQHHHTYAYSREVEKVGSITKRTPYTHTCKVQIVTYKTCTLCRNVAATAEDDPKVSTLPHDPDENGNCRVCGYHVECDHPKTTVVNEVEGYTKVEKKDNKYHTYTNATVYSVVRCQDCNKVLSKTVVNPNESSREELHQFASGYCTVCGYKNECQHEHQVTWTKRTMVYDIKSNGTKTHSFRTDETDITACADCGELIDTFLRKDIKQKEKHTFVDGVCNTCGAKKGQGVAKATPTPVPLRTDEMVTALLIDIQREQMTVGTTLEIVGVDQVLTETELARYATLTMPEKLLAAFAALGMQPDTVYGTQTMNLVPSAAAQTLISDIAARRLRMTAEERAAVEAAIATYFTKEVDATGRQTMTITLRVMSPTGTVDRRYTFRYDTLSKLWLYVKMELVNEESIGVK